MKKSTLIIIILISAILILLGMSVNNLSKKGNSDNVEHNEKSKINSKELSALLENDWDSDKVNFGTIDSHFQDYDLYFDEGLEVRTINGKVHNIVFTEKYKKNVIDKIKVKDSLEDVVEKLGEPAYGGISVNLIGYKRENYYVFFTGKQISIYRNDQKDESINTALNNNGSTVKEFINNIAYSLVDYDKYEVIESDGKITYCNLRYPYIGINIQCKKDKIEVQAYDNCYIKINDSDKYEITVKKKNLVYEVENERQNSIHNIDYVNRLFSDYKNNNAPEADYTSSDLDNEYKMIESSKFYFIMRDYNKNYEYKLLVASLDGEYPSFEFDELIMSSIWLDDFNIVYSVKNKGIYLYNIKSKKKTTIKEGTDDFVIQGITKDDILKYDDNEIKINI